MATPAQIRANRANAQRSTGPRTETGKQVTKNNAMKHGLASERLVTRGEDPAALDALRADLQAEHQPANQTETMLVDDLAMCWWRLLRARKYEATLINCEKPAMVSFEHNQLAGIERYTASAERGWNRALTQLRAAQNDRRKCEQRCPAPAPVPQPEETEKVMTVGSVLQIEPEPAETPETAPAPAIAALPELENAAAAGEDARPDAQNGKITAGYRCANDFLAVAKNDLARLCDSV